MNVNEAKCCVAVHPFSYPSRKRRWLVLNQIIYDNQQFETF